jgi:hypothetical protein
MHTKLSPAERLSRILDARHHADRVYRTVRATIDHASEQYAADPRTYRAYSDALSAHTPAYHRVLTLENLEYLTRARIARASSL